MTDKKEPDEINESTDTVQPTEEFEEKESLFQFPCDFPLKVIGEMQDGFTQSVVDAILKVIPAFNPKNITIRPSKENKYVSITAEVPAESKEQLDELYLTVHKVPGVRMLL